MALALVACTANDDTTTGTLSGDGEKTPLLVSATLNDGAVASRATDNKFDDGDQLLSYVRHVTWDGTENGQRNSVTADKAPRLVEFTYGSSQTEGDPTSTTKDLTVSGGLYWDDFSNSASEATDLRTAGHYLQSYYGYCYNGGVPSTELTESSGTLGWSAPTDQTTADAVKKADLLWSAEQTPIMYSHADKNVGGNHNTLQIPYTHAMSEVTIIVKTGVGFEDVAETALNNTTVNLTGWNKTGTFTAPSQQVSGTPGIGTDDGIIKMYKGGSPSVADKVATCKYVAMTVPQTSLTIGNTIAKINDADGNNYDIKLTQAMVAESAWGQELDGGPEGFVDNGIAQTKSHATISKGTSYLTRPGVHYTLTITLHKVSVKVEASISTWKDVYAETSAISDFAHDIVSFNFEGFTPNANDAFSIYALNSNGISTLSNELFENGKKSVVTYVNSEWTCEPILYWPNGTDALYFRGLATYEGTSYKKYTGTDVSQGNDVIWSTTAAHTGNDIDGVPFSYAIGQAIKPRTGQVPLQMEHAMAKISVNLITTTGAAAVNLEGATIEISNIATSGTIAIADGAITPATQSGSITPQSVPLENYCVIPQNIGDTSYLIITLADGTKYKAQLNKCIDDNSTAEPKSTIASWIRGNHYKYTIYLEKEKITFRALIKDWTESTGSGNANLEWD